MRTTLSVLRAVVATVAGPLALSVTGASVRLASGQIVLPNNVVHPIRPVHGSGVLPAGWQLRFDPLPQRVGPPFKFSDIILTATGSDLHIESGPAAIYYKTSDVAKGQFTWTATFTQPSTVGHEAYGIFIGGTNLQKSTQRYLYFIVRTQGAAFLISKRMSDSAPVTLAKWTSSDAVKEESGRAGSATNTLSIQVAKDSVFFLANGRRVKALSKKTVGIATNGQVGLRINHNIVLAVTGMRIEKK